MAHRQYAHKYVLWSSKTYLQKYVEARFYQQPLYAGPCSRASTLHPWKNVTYYLSPEYGYSINMLNIWGMNEEHCLNIGKKKSSVLFAMQLCCSSHWNGPSEMSVNRGLKYAPLVWLGLLHACDLPWEEQSHIFTTSSVIRPSIADPLE